MNRKKIEELEEQFVGEFFDKQGGHPPFEQPTYADAIEWAMDKQKAIDIEIIPQLYVRWLMIDGEKPSWKEYAIKAMEE